MEKCFHMNSIKMAKFQKTSSYVYPKEGKYGFKILQHRSMTFCVKLIFYPNT
jgi:hypothetical protein